MQEERILIKKIIDGDMTAFKLLIKQYERLVAFIISRIIPHEEDIKDVTQEIFIKVHKNLPKFNFRSKLSTWIGKIAYHTAISYAERSSNNESIYTNADELLYEKKLVDHDTPERLLLAKDEAALIHFYISRLPLAYRTVITLYHLNEFSYQEIEEITGMPEGTVKNYLFRARKLLKERLKRYYKLNRS